ncbi:hypothetical protein [Streptomyces sp. TLI_171]|uniref:hypothetical protein n=1 Tax=Streptomyces sp. TLI_171 TaxID=1938859 RepID=UPI000C4EFD62|nr:hypothetical protein [Streptomyces sp. TLI_171]RKE23273.1 hypothetical protein BX266_6735 [Streptomyces sp. TLI_171]
MSVRQLAPVLMEADLAAWAEATAAKAGLSTAQYLAALVEADRRATAAERAARLAAPAYQQWDADGRPTEDGLDLDEVFGP